MNKDFSHVQETTLYMEAVKHVIDRLPPGKLLDCPAGKGIIGDFARARGFTVTSADINEERKDFVYCDMDQPLPFADGEFDVTVSLEGVEHLLYPTAFLRELVRVTQPGGTIILSTPNTANFYSRLQFLLTGTFFQFAPKDIRNIGDRKIDRGHVSSLTPSQIHYFMSTFGAELMDFELDRAKKKIFWPLAALLYPFMAMASHNVSKGHDPLAFKGNYPLARLLLGYKPLWSRSAVFIFRKLPA